MREILFRGKRLDNGEWAYGTPIFYSQGTVVREVCGGGGCVHQREGGREK